MQERNASCLSSVEACCIIVHATLSSFPFFPWGTVSSLLDTFAEMSRRKPRMYHGAESCYDRMLGILVSDGSAPKRRRQSWQQAHLRSSEPRMDNFIST